MVEAIVGLFFLTSAYPLAVAWRANRRTALFQTVNWAVVAWAAWGWSMYADFAWSATSAAAVRYFALALTGCAGIAVLGARRPGVGAWNFVLVGLLAVWLLPLAEQALSGGQLQLAGPRTLFVAGTLAVIVLNYLPTRLGPAALLLALGCAAAFVTVADAESWMGHIRQLLVAGHTLLAAAAWLAYQMRRCPVRSEFDRLWLDFRDRFGLLWGQRMREQFNRAAANAGWPVVLRWQGLRTADGVPPPEATVAVLRALLKRFWMEPDGP
jgi:hypothetical protein